MLKGFVHSINCATSTVRDLHPHAKVVTFRDAHSSMSMNMDDVLKAARRATAANKLFEASKPVPKKPVSRLEALQKRFDQLVGMHTATEALLAAGGGDLPASLPPSRRSMSPEAAPSLPLPPRSAGGSPCYAIGEQPGVERGPRLRLQPSISTPALRRHGPSPGP